MGVTTPVRPLYTQAEKNLKSVKPLRFGIDIPYLLVVITLLTAGFIFLYSASMPAALWEDQPLSPSTYVLTQARNALVGAAAAFIVFKIDYRKLQKYMVPMVLVTLVLLLVVLVFGQFRLGAKRALFDGSIQPSELAKLVVIIYLSYWLNSKHEVIEKITFGLVPLGVILGLFAGLIALQPDYSAAITVVVLGGILFFLAGADLKQILLIVILAGALGFGVTQTDTGKNRIEKYVPGINEPENADIHIKRSIEAIVDGGLFGVGIGKGTVKFTGLPVAQTDSIFAVVTEETGIMGASIIILLFIFLLWRGIKIALNAPDLLGKLLAGGISFWIFFEAALNMGVMVNLFPFAGNTLPFFSLGGSSLVTVLTGVGFVLSVARVSANEKISKEGRTFGAVVNLRRGDGGRSVSRSRRSSGSRS